jgi:hypothetical protein
MALEEFIFKLKIETKNTKPLNYLSFKKQFQELCFSTIYNTLHNTFNKSTSIKFDFLTLNNT